LPREQLAQAAVDLGGDRIERQCRAPAEVGRAARGGGGELLAESRRRAPHRPLDEDRHAGDERHPGAEQPTDAPAHQAVDLAQRLGEIDSHRRRAARRARLVTARARVAGGEPHEAAYPLPRLGVGLDPGLGVRPRVGEEGAHALLLGAIGRQVR
jgi:hypothetical protein